MGKDHDALFQRTALALSGVATTDEYVDLLSREKMPEHVELLRDVLQPWHELLAKLEARLGDRKCASCSVPISGRTDKIFCSHKCLQRARRIAARGAVGD